MIKVFLPRDNISHVTNEILVDVVEKLFETNHFEQEREERSRGRYIKILNENTGDVHFVCFSNPDNNGRNSHLMQFIAPTAVEFYNCENENKYLDIYLIAPGVNDQTDYIKFFYRCFLTLGYKILQLDSLRLDGITPFNNYSDIKHARDSNRESNTGNKSTFFTDDEDQISFYGKVFGANAMETFILILALQETTNRHIVYYPVVDNNSSSLSIAQLEIMRRKGIEIGQTISEINNQDINIESDEKGLRNTPKFHYNLLKKYGEKKCYLCGCDMEHMIIGSHVERVADIKNSSEYSEDNKKTRIVDGDNGFWLCANHDKMFEFGIIYFEGDEMKIKEPISGLSKTFIDKVTFDVRSMYYGNNDENVENREGVPMFKIKQSDYTSKMHRYLEIHRARVLNLQN